MPTVLSSEYHLRGLGTEAMLYVRTTIITTTFSFFPQGLKTGMYYLRTKAAANAIQFTVDQTVVKKAENTNSGEESSPQKDKDYQEKAMACSLENREACLMCSAWPGHMISLVPLITTKTFELMCYKKL